jgi:hypothetical protein
MREAIDRHLGACGSARSGKIAPINIRQVTPERAAHNSKGMNMSTRSQSHVIDSKAVKAVMRALPHEWVIRELTERDYGIDLMVEIFVAGKKDARGLDTYAASGWLFHIQVKGTEEPIVAKKDGFISYSMKKTALQYTEQFAVPFFLFRTDVSSTSAKIYFVWLQRYVSDELDIHQPLWRERKKPETVSIQIPAGNRLNLRALKRIEKIAYYPKYMDELIEFRDIFFHAESMIGAMATGKHDISKKSLLYVGNQLYRMTRLKLLLRKNDCCIDLATVEDVIKYFRGLDFRSVQPGALASFPHRYNLELLFNSIDDMRSVDSLLSEAAGHTPY